MKANTGNTHDDANAAAARHDASSYSAGVDAAVVAAHGISPAEYEKLLGDLKRAPNITELGIYSALWSEHCSYKSTRVWLETLPTTGVAVIHGPGENAGAVDIGSGMAAVFKIESHNHPSFIEPFQGAATGVGGIMRDVFAMGARPVANLNVLHFGAPDHPKTRQLLKGVVSGIGFYGNCSGVPTVAGETGFNAGFNDNILVNAMCVGIARHDGIFTARADRVGSTVVYVGGRTGRDGVRGAVMASADFSSATSEDQRPSVQVGDPYLEKMLIEACLELMREEAILAVQDMGAAGLASSSVEMAARGGVGIALNLDAVPRREADISAYEIMLSESQERMLLVLDANKVDLAERIFGKWGLEAVAVGEITAREHLVVTKDGKTEIDLPISCFESGAPRYRRDYEIAPPPPPLGGLKELRLQYQGASCSASEPQDLGDILMRLMGGVHLGSRGWIWQQYDHLVGGQAVSEPGGDAAVLRVRGHEDLAIAACVDSSPRYCAASAKMGAMQCVAEARRNLIAVGASVLAITNNLNFGNPEQPRIMGQIVAAIDGIGEACRAFDLPVVSGNVSLYNATDGESIPPTPVIGALGVVKNWRKSTSIALKGNGDTVFVIGESDGDLGQSLYARDVMGITHGAPPAVDFAGELQNGALVTRLIEEELVNAVHDISDGGLLVALAEMALAGDRGVEVRLTERLEGDNLLEWLFCETQARYLVAARPGCANSVMQLGRDLGVAVYHLGMVTGHRLVVPGARAVSLDALRRAHENALNQVTG